MVRSAPQISFSLLSVNYGTIDVADSGHTQSYNIYGHGYSAYFTDAINMSISMKEDSNASEVRNESWIWISTAASGGKEHVGSYDTGPEASVDSVVASSISGTSQNVRTNIIVPSGAGTAGAVSFYLHHRYQYTG